MRSLLLFLLLTVPVLSANAAIKTWTGAGADANWGTSANWSPAGSPVANDDLVFPAAAPQQSNNNNTTLFTTYRSITIEGGTYTIGGNPLRLTSGITVNSGTQTLNTAITLSGAQTFTSANAATATIVILSVGSNTLTIDGTGALGIGLLSGSGRIVKAGTGASLIAAATGYSGEINVNGGILVNDASTPSSYVLINTGNANPNPNLPSGFGGTGSVGIVDVFVGAISAGTLTSPTGVLNINGILHIYPAGTYVCKIAGSLPGANGHDQLNVTGTVNLDSSTLIPLPFNNFRPAIGESLVIIRNDGTDAVIGTFRNLPEGGVFSGALNTAYQITYQGGDGNDVAIKRIPRSPFDFDADGKTDVSTVDQQTATWDIDQSTSGPRSVQLGLPTDKIVPADYDGDNKADIAVFRNGSWLVLGSISTTVVTTAFGSPGDIPIPNDFDGDGRADFAVFRPSTGIWYQLRSLGNQFYAQQFGANGDIPQMADIDGDGLGDLAVYRPTGGEWHFWQSATNSYLAFPFGISTDKPVIADYDGDGRSDVAVFRGTDDSNLPDFYILLTNGGVYYGLSWGITGDIPVVGDYDGDGRADIGIYRPGTNFWYILGSTAGLSQQQWGNGQVKPIPSAYVP
ncbi:MAG: FG-GAP-like repeat-containing protein [Pyrinomonadaceae bacterium]